MHRTKWTICPFRHLMKNEVSLSQTHLSRSLTNFSLKVDPTTLCQYCDQPFPLHPSPLLQAMLQRVQRKSYRDPRPANPLGLKAPLLTYINLCQRHRFETHQLPKAKANGWPTDINFAAIPDRVIRLKSLLQQFIVNRETSPFWREVREEIEKEGTRKVTGIAGQFMAFEKSQPG